MTKLLLNDKTFSIIGSCMEVHTYLGPGLKEIDYKDALELELRNRKIPFDREKKYEVEYKGCILPHHYYADFVIYEDIILEAKAITGFTDNDTAQILNYISIAKSPVGLLVNFGRKSLIYKRFIGFDK